MKPPPQEPTAHSDRVETVVRVLVTPCAVALDARLLLLALWPLQFFFLLPRR